MEKELILFEERQYFRQNWLWWLVGIAFVVNMTIILAASFQEENPKTGLMVAALFAALMAPVILLLYFQNLKTVVTNKGIRFRFKPFHFKERFIPWSAVEKAWVRKYKPIMEFGGWGIRVAFRKRVAYNVSGNMGLQLELSDGRKILIGTARAEELEGILRESGFLKSKI